MLNLTLITVGALKNKALQTLAADYQQRLAPYARLRVIETAAASFSAGDKKRAKKLEKEALLKVLHRHRSESIYLLAEQGNLLDSQQFATLLNEFDGQELVLVIGGSLGWEAEWRQQYRCLSLSTLTFPHELARVLLLEQLYRGVLINAGKEYHY